MSIDSILAEFDRLAPRFRDAASDAERLVRRLVRGARIPVMAVQGRPKERESLESKLVRKPERYSQLADVTDCVGLRVITRFEDDTHRVVSLLRNEFEIDEENTLDKADELQPQEFAYRSIHVICSLGPRRESLGEHDTLVGIKFEVQVRSMLQHAWAEIEHELEYKRDQASPARRRRFSRLAGMLELVDEQFMALRDDSMVLEAAGETVGGQDGPGIGVDDLVRVIDTEPVRQLDAKISAWVEIPITRMPVRLETTSRGLAVFGLRERSDLLAELDRRSDEVIRFVQAWIPGGRGPRGMGYAHGISLFFLGYLLAAQAADVATTRAYIAAAELALPGEIESLANRLRTTWRELCLEGEKRE